MVVPPLYKKQKTSLVFFVTEIMLSCVLTTNSGFSFSGSIFMFVTRLFSSRHSREPPSQYTTR